MYLRSDLYAPTPSAARAAVITPQAFGPTVLVRLVRLTSGPLSVAACTVIHTRATARTKPALQQPGTTTLTREDSR